VNSLFLYFQSNNWQKYLPCSAKKPSTFVLRISLAVSLLQIPHNFVPEFHYGKLPDSSIKTIDRIIFPFLTITKHNIQFTIYIKIIGVYFKWFFFAGFVFIIQSKITNQVIVITILIDINTFNTIPPAKVSLNPNLSETSTNLFEEF